MKQTEKKKNFGFGSLYLRAILFNALYKIVQI